MIGNFDNFLALKVIKPLPSKFKERNIKYILNILELCSSLVCCTNVQNGFTLYLHQANITTDLRGLMDLLVDPNERQGYAWIRMRIKRIWPRWAVAIQELAQKQDMGRRKQKKVLVHLGLLSKQSGWKFAEMQFKGSYI